MRTGPVIVGGCLAAMTCAPAARAVAPTVSVVSACQGLDVELVERLLGIELSSVMGTRPHDLRVRVFCSSHRVTIRIVDRVSQRTVRRSFAARHDRPDLERVVALASAQLVVVSWLELLTRPSPGNAKASPSRPAPPIVQRGSLPPPPAQRWWSASLGLEAGIELRDLSRPLPLYCTALRLGLGLGRRWQLTLALAFAGGRARRIPGEVELLLPGLRVSALWRWLERKHLEISSEIRLAVSYVRLRGLPDTPAQGSVVHGFAGNAAWGNGPWIRLGRLRLGLQLLVGVTFPKVLGRVERDRNVRLDGLWLGTTLILEGVLW